MRNLTKESRNKSREIQFRMLLGNGFKQETYLGLDFFTKDESGFFTLKVYRGNAANHEEYINYRSKEKRDLIIQNYKTNYDNRLKYKAEQKAKGTQVSSHAQAAAAVKAELQAKFKGVKFSAKSESYSGGDSLRIYWTNGPTVAEVEAISSKYQCGHFNGMEDIYEYTNRIDGLPQAKYVFEERTVSEDLKILLPQLEALLEGYISEDWHNTTEKIFYRICGKTSFPVSYKSATIVKTDCGCGSMEDFYQIVFEVEQTKEPIQQTKAPEPQNVPEGKIQIIQYSEKSIAVIGDTKPIKDKLKELGGSFNFRLSCGAGWIFPMSKLNALQTSLGSQN